MLNRLICSTALAVVLPICGAGAQAPFDPCAPETPQEAAKLDRMRDGGVVRVLRKQHCEEQKRRDGARQEIEAQHAAQAAREREEQQEKLDRGGAQARKEAQSGEKKLATIPSCTKIKFTGLGMGMPSYYSEIVQLESDPSSTQYVGKVIRENPLKCRPSAITQVYGCVGVDWFEDQPGYVVNWDSDVFWIISTIELEGGDHDATIIVRRRDSECVDSVPPQLAYRDSMMAYFNTQPLHR